MIEFAGLVIWLALGGWSFATLAEDTDRDTIVGLAWACVLFAPFMAGGAVADIGRKRRARLSEKPKAPAP